ncbi:histamine H2 receptor-like [Montipora capricornis]|uniref:histamine H2 receptor-like n=1 Tax=Montipora foliosa TaxID=591990 RepID=UPI0035F117EB
MPRNNGNNTTTLSPSSSVGLVIESSFFIILSLIILAGNTLVCTAIYKNRKLRTKTNYYIVSLAVADIMVGVFSVPYWVYFRLVNPGADNDAYKVYITYDIMCGTASIINLVMISLERCLSVTEPAIHRNLSRTTITVTIVCAWIYALLVACVNLVNGSYRKWYPPFVSTVSFFLPLFVILIAYSLIYKVARTRERARRSRSLAREIRIAVTLAVVIGAFVIAWLPFFTMLLISTYCRTCQVNYDIIIPFTKWMHYSGSMVNPVIYTHRNKDFRRAFARILFSCGKRQMINLSQPAKNSQNFVSARDTSASIEGGNNNENQLRTRSSSYVFAQGTKKAVLKGSNVNNETRA